MKHIFLVTVDHKDPLPVRPQPMGEHLSLTDVLSDRAWQWCNAMGVPVEVTASMIVAVDDPLVPQKKESWEKV